MILFSIFLFLAILLESTITTLPLVLLLILFLAVTRKSNDVFVVAFVAGLILDILSFGWIGFSSMYFVLLTFLIFMYQRKFEIETVNFLVLFSFFGSLIYLLIEGVRFAFIQSIVMMLIIATSYYFFRKFNKKIPKYA